MHALKIAIRYLQYFLNAVDEHSLHSPFIFDLYSHVIKPDEDEAKFEKFKNVREELSRDKRMIRIKDLGAGSAVNNKPSKTISQILRLSATPSKQSRLFHRLIRFFDHEYIIELGSSIGINTLYLASASDKAQVYTIEGCPATAAVAHEVFNRFGKLNINLIEGNIDFRLPDLVAKLPSIDFAYFDANHTYDATRRYFETCLPKVHDRTVLVFDDIHWSDGMEKAWAAIKNHEKVSMTIDLFDSGLVFFRPLYIKQHYVLSY